ncbi:hypothetical protein KI387_005534, partial [Taxus chinensis]
MDRSNDAPICALAFFVMHPYIDLGRARNYGKQIYIWRESASSPMDITEPLDQREQSEQNVAYSISWHSTRYLSVLRRRVSA